jgi:uncharacterized protein
MRQSLGRGGNECQDFASWGGMNANNTVVVISLVLGPGASGYLSSGYEHRRTRRQSVHFGVRAIEYLDKLSHLIQTRRHEITQQNSGILNASSQMPKKKHGRPVQLVRQASGKHPRELAPALFGAHGAILAQSGSGKSFLLGRLVEELLLTTKARVVIIDPNSDFLYLDKAAEDIWTDDRFKQWFYPDEGKDEFTKLWAKVLIRIMSNRNVGTVLPIRIDWGNLSAEEMAAVLNVDARVDPELVTCISIAADAANEQWAATTEQNYDFPFYRARTDELVDFLLTGTGTAFLANHPIARALLSAGSQHVAHRLRANMDLLDRYEIWRHTGEATKDIAEIVRGKWRSLVIDLQSLTADEERLAIVTRALETIWIEAKEQLWEATRDPKEADHRVPTFIVVDEAHNLVPAERHTPAAGRVAGMLIRIAAEGRKYGLFLLVATQRPRKIDSNILSECENLILMKMKNETDITYAKDVLGYLESDISLKARSLAKGDALLRGNINVTGDILHCAPRRTVEGGKSLDDDYWAEP